MVNTIPIQILYVDDCPNYTKACKVICDIISERSLDANISIRKISDNDMDEHPFRGSPTVLVDGQDVEVCYHEGTERDVSAEILNLAACRLYNCDIGKGCPSHEMINCAVNRAENNST